MNYPLSKIPPQAGAHKPRIVDQLGAGTYWKNGTPDKIPTLTGPSKPYVINELDVGSFEIQMYGEVVNDRPTDWVTGKPDDGLYIVLSEFLSDLDRLQNADSITVRINSPGGDLEAAASIYNRLKAMNHVTTIVDGLAASAASLIMQAGETRKVYRNSEIMVHGPQVMLCDYYNLPALQEIEKWLTAANEQVINTYVERTGRDRVKVKHMVEDTTWMTGQQIIDEGFADELIEETIPMAMSADHKFVLSNGLKIDSRVFGKILPAIKDTVNAGVPAEPTKEVKSMTLDELKEKEPDLVKQIEDSAKASVDVNSVKAQAQAEERKRIEEIESIEASIADKDLVNEAKFGDTPMNARDLAFTAMQKQAQIGNTVLGNMLDDSNASGAKNVKSEPNGGIEDDLDAQAKAKAKDQEDIAAAAKALGYRKETK